MWLYQPVYFFLKLKIIFGSFVKTTFKPTGARAHMKFKIKNRKTNITKSRNISLIQLSELKVWYKFLCKKENPDRIQSTFIMWFKNFNK